VVCKPDEIELLLRVEEAGVAQSVAFLQTRIQNRNKNVDNDCPPDCNLCGLPVYLAKPCSERSLVVLQKSEYGKAELIQNNYNAENSSNIDEIVHNSMNSALGPQISRNTDALSANERIPYSQSIEINDVTEIVNDEQHQRDHSIPLSRKDIVNAENSSSFGRICHKCNFTFHSYCMPSHKIGLNPALSSSNNGNKPNDVNTSANYSSEPTSDTPWYCWKCQGVILFPSCW
jgi:hypothetical protein